MAKVTVLATRALLLFVHKSQAGPPPPGITRHPAWIPSLLHGAQASLPEPPQPFRVLWTEPLLKEAGKHPDPRWPGPQARLCHPCRGCVHAVPTRPLTDP